MNRLAVGASIVLCTLIFCLLPCITLVADPSQAIPSLADPVEEKLSRLSAEERLAIELPRRAHRVVFVIARGGIVPSNHPESMLQQTPWLTAYADGRIVCTMLDRTPQRREDKISQAELLWLLHLVVNRCKGLERTTGEIPTEFELPSFELEMMAAAYDRTIDHYIDVAAGTNEFSVPLHALMLRSTIDELNLHAFLDLQRYVGYLVARSFLGTAAERAAILRTLNEELGRQHPDLPPFEMAHLGSAVEWRETDVLPATDLSAVFVNEIDLGNDQFKRVTGIIRRKGPDSKLKTSFLTTEYRKHRPGPSEQTD